MYPDNHTHIMLNYLPGALRDVNHIYTTRLLYSFCYHHKNHSWTPPPPPPPRSSLSHFMNLSIIIISELVLADFSQRPDNNKINHEILKQINKSAVIKMTGARIGFKFWLRFVVSGRYTDSEDVQFSWDMIRRTTNKVIATSLVFTSSLCQQ